MKTILYIGNQLESKGATPATIDRLSNLLSAEGYSVYKASGKKNKILRLLDMWFQVIKLRKKIDVVLIDTYSTKNFYYATSVASLCRRYSIPYIPILHGGNLPVRLSKSKRLSHKLFGNARVNVSPSGYLEKIFMDHGFKNTLSIPNSVEIKKYPFTKRSLQPKLLWVRSFSAIYNPMLALQIVEELKPVYPDVELCMVGTDKDGSLQTCKAYAKEKNLNVQFTGKLTRQEWTEVSKRYSIFINTTNFDNMPVSLIEAMLLGMPIVSTNVGGIPYLLSDEEALLVAPNDEKIFSEAIQHTIKNPNTTLERIEKAHEKALFFDWNRVKLQWHEILS